MVEKYSLIMIVFAAMVAAGCSPKPSQSDLPTPQVEAVETVISVEALPTAQVPEGWHTYSDAEYELSFSYPDPYKVLTDADNLSGWDNGLLLIYDGGQSYDIALQVWNSVDEMEMYFGARLGDVKVFETQGKYLSVFNITMEDNNAAIIDTIVVN